MTGALALRSSPIETSSVPVGRGGKVGRSTDVAVDGSTAVDGAKSSTGSASSSAMYPSQSSCTGSTESYLHHPTASASPPQSSSKDAPNAPLERLAHRLPLPSSDEPTVPHLRLPPLFVLVALLELGAAAVADFAVGRLELEVLAADAVRGDG